MIADIKSQHIETVRFFRRPGPPCSHSCLSLPAGMHKKSVESSQTSPRKTVCSMPPPVMETLEGKASEEQTETHRKDSNADISKEELREHSIAALRAKAQEHSAKLIGTVPDTASSREEEAGEQGVMEQDAAKRSN